MDCHRRICFHRCIALNTGLLALRHGSPTFQGLGEGETPFQTSVHLQLTWFSNLLRTAFHYKLYGQWQTAAILTLPFTP
ncbi:hypothetical protein H6G45_07115 [Synechocystis sp. FACHB-383]|uniref:hypothetical protein n=1 Tax=Synechocystis sp. FACHB-383 TaxID=2692864 RepID=UPI0016897E46|nr:hypothetical protein [Synechocystis sp. FACHB-383]MBD2653260.1 hypothetical protein [Synechocystis sp. FACHB-383]